MKNENADVILPSGTARKAKNRHAKAEKASEEQVFSEVTAEVSKDFTEFDNSAVPGYLDGINISEESADSPNPPDLVKTPDRSKEPEDQLNKETNDKDEEMKETAKKTSKTKEKTARKRGAKLYTDYSAKLKAKKEAAARRKAEDLATLPKGPVKRFFARLHPKRVFRWWFSWRGQKTILKTIGVLLILMIIAIGGLFLYYKKDLDEIRLDEMTISETVNTYLDRNGVVLWKDTGNDNYRLVVSEDEISPYMYQATVAIEDRNFYNHIGVDPIGLVRAFLSTITGHGVQGGSTLTQQLIKQVYFADEAQSANRGGLQRKIKELILAIELERMYSKDEIITMYLNQSPYGGRRNGVESAAQTYFGKSAKDLTLAESALLASIPNNPAVFNPYNTYGHEQLLWRQQHTLDVMADMGYITREEAEAAKQVAILDTIKPESNQYAGMLAPHFVLEVKQQLEEKYGISTMRAGGWTITTTIDYRAQQIAEDAIAVGMEQTYKNGTDNMALVSVDVESAQVIAMVGSADFFGTDYGEFNVATDALIEPGSSIKPILDYSPLFMERKGINYGPGSILRDENIDSIYCAGASGRCTMTNATNTYYGDVTIRFSLGHSLNIAAVKALYINGIDNSLEIAHALGDKTYCENRSDYGLSIAIGSGCNVRMVEHANAYASLARGGAYKELVYVLEVKNATGDVIEQWTDSEAVQVVDPQVAYMISDILSDRSARWSNSTIGFNIPDVWTATKTGTTTTENSAEVKDSLIESYSTAISTFVWNGNHDGAGFENSGTGSGDPVRYAVGEYMERVHREVYEPEGKWSPGDEPVRPDGIKTLTVNGKTDIWPSWFDAEKNSGITKETMTFNKYTHALAAACTPEAYKIEIEVKKIIDPVTEEATYDVPEPYNRELTDACTYTPPQVSLSRSGNALIATVKKGTYNIVGATLYVDGKIVESGVTVNNNRVNIRYSITGEESSVRLTISDQADYYATSELTLTPTKTNTDTNETRSN